ncbi:MAG: hypothetical protein ABI429_00615 [Jatrophihabitantaceae bacterium]
MLADARLTPTVRVVGRALLLALAAVLLLVLDHGSARATTPPTPRAVAQAAAVDAPQLDPAQAAVGAPRAAATPSPSTSSSPSKSKKKKSSSSSLILIIVLGVAVVIYLTSRKRKTANGGATPARGGLAGLFGGSARRPPPQPLGERIDDLPGPPSAAAPAPRADGRPRSKRRGRR